LGSPIRALFERSRRVQYFDIVRKMNKSKQFYKTLPAEVLHEYAEKGGLGYEDPIDLKEFLKFIKNGDSVLEIGCGTGRIGKHLINEKYVGLETNQDYANFFIEKIKEKYKDNIKNIDFLDFKSDKLFDVILFPWSVFWDFSSEEQKEVIKKSLELLLIILRKNLYITVLMDTSPT
jgi:SAM-dependent methyltransferase